jgi:DNA-binding MarR family transcriptional regulator
MASSLKPSEYALLSEFRHLLRQFLAFSEDRAAAIGLAPQQHQALLAIKGYGGDPTVGDLARRLVVRHNSAVGLVNRLVAAGLVNRNIDDSDRRRAKLRLTRRGEALLARLSAAHRRELRRISEPLQELLAQLSK